MQKSIADTLSSLPKHPGVYIYRNQNQTVIYVGKAVDLSKRVKQYFTRDDAVGDKTPKLVSEIHSIETIETASEFDALLLEAKLIKQFLPKFNVIAKDDKSPLYIAISWHEDLPKIYFSRKPKPALDNNPEIAYFGPFQSGKTARQLLRSLRRVVPYCTQKIRNGKPCFYTHLGLCSPCPSYISKLETSPLKQKLSKEYRAHIFRIRDILLGKSQQVIQELEKEMLNAAKREEFESAQSIKNQIEALKTIVTKRHDPEIYLQSDSLVTELFEQECQNLRETLLPFFPNLNTLNRIECFDISNTSGLEATASMVVATNGRIDTGEYRRFKIRSLKTPNDFAMMQQAIKRRFTHPEWQLPDLLVIDGGKGQISSVLEVLSEAGLSTLPVIGLAKREEEIVIKTTTGFKVLRLPLRHEGLKLIQRLRDEAHRFAKKYHTYLRQAKL